jgi:CheY-like chemotaxis protein
MLESKFNIATATSGEEGLTMLCAHGPFAAVVTDMQMTGMDGVQFLKRAREITPNAMRLLLTDYLDLQGAVNAVNEGPERRASADRDTSTFIPARSKFEGAVGPNRRYLQLRSAARSC